MINLSIRVVLPDPDLPTTQIMGGSSGFKELFRDKPIGRKTPI
jgi:hypothetical protein